jgi:hypothetical protein
MSSLSAGVGLEVAVVYSAMSPVATLPEALVLWSGRVPTGVHVSPANADYLAAKARHGAHDLEVGQCRESRGGRRC